MNAHNYDLEFNVSGLLKQTTGASRTYHFETPDLQLYEESVAHQIVGDAGALRIKTGILVQGTVTANVEMECSRCLVPFVGKIEASFEEEFRPTVDIISGVSMHEIREGEYEGDYSWLTHDHMMNLTEVVRQAIIVNMPYNPICSPDCAGLCPECGADLNVEHCGHMTAKLDNRLSVLASLLEQLKD